MIILKASNACASPVLGFAIRIGARSHEFVACILQSTIDGELLVILLGCDLVSYQLIDEGLLLLAQSNHLVRIHLRTNNCILLKVWVLLLLAILSLRKACKTSLGHIAQTY